MNGDAIRRVIQFTTLYGRMLEANDNLISHLGPDQSAENTQAVLEQLETEGFYEKIKEIQELIGRVTELREQCESLRRNLPADLITDDML
jgi:hypothetical protein